MCRDSSAACYANAGSYVKTLLFGIGDASDPSDTLNLYFQTRKRSDFNMTCSIKSRVLWCVVGFFILTSLGCGGAYVSGKVTFDDGTPLTVGTVCFETDKEQMIGHIKNDGTYELSPNDRNKRIPKGLYKVCVTNAVVEVGNELRASGNRADFGGRRMTKSIIDKKFESASSSGLTCDVKGTTVYDITVTKAN